MKILIKNSDGFVTWIDEQKRKYSIYNKMIPVDFPCIVVTSIIENDYFDSPDWLDFDFVYKTDFNF